MNLFEYQGKALFQSSGIAVPEGILVSDPAQLPENVGEVVVKPQVLTGGRGKAGAIQICRGREEAALAVKNSLKASVKGHRVSSVLVEEKINIQQEYYLSISINRKSKQLTIMFSNQGGVDIEKAADGAIASVDVDILIGLRDYMVKRLLAPFSMADNASLQQLIRTLYQLFMEHRLQMAEINPLVLTPDGAWIALDAKVITDDGYADPFLSSQTQVSDAESSFERFMADHHVNATEMCGDIVVFAAGAGVSMALGDSVAKHGGSLSAIIDLGILPCDSTDEAVSDQSAKVLQKILDLQPKAILINLYFQAARLDMACRTMKKAFADAAKELPIIVRCKGRMAPEGLAALQGTAFLVTGSYEEACRLAVAKAKEAR